MPPEVLAQKSQKWIQMQRKRYGEKRKGGFVDMGKQVRAVLTRVFELNVDVCDRTCHQSTFAKSSRTTVT